MRLTDRLELENSLMAWEKNDVWFKCAWAYGQIGERFTNAGYFHLQRSGS